jgi:hypothetical protein
LILLLIFIAALAGVFFFLRSDEEGDTVYEEMSHASLPVVYAIYEGRQINPMYGYTEQMKDEYMRDDVTPVSQDGQLEISVDCYTDVVTKISYELRDSSSGRLLEDTSITDWTVTSQAVVTGDRIQAALPVGKLISSGQEYLLRICLETEENGAVYYYTRILYTESSHIDEMIDFAEYFSDRTFAEEEKEEGSTELSTYIEPDKTGDNTSLAYINIHSSHSMLTWMNLAPQKTGETSVKVRQLTGSVGTIRLSYSIQATGDTGLTETYQVEETFVLRYSSVRFYLLAYERTVEQVFEAGKTSIDGGVVDLGIQPDDTVQVESSSNGTYTVFTVNGELWGYSSSQNEAIKIFSFRNGTQEDVRTEHNEHDYRIIEVKENGDCSFMVYGYMNSGSHQGEVGMVFYQYDHSDRALQEIFYIPAYTTYSLLRQEIGTLNYISDTGLIYVMVENAIYAIDVEGTEQVVVVDHLSEGTYAISEDNSAIGWQEGEELYGCTTLSLLYLSDGKKTTVTAAEGTCLKPLGFIGSDFIYGIADEKDITTDISGQTIFPMYAVEIVNREGEILAHYEETEAYVLGIQVDDGRIQLNCAHLTAEKTVRDTFTDVMLQNTETGSESASVLVSSTSQRKKKVYAINLSKYLGSSSLTIQTPVRLLNPSVHRINLNTGLSRENDTRYFAYSYGNLAGIYYNLSDAIHAIYSDVGLVMDAGQNLVWVRGSQSQEARITIDNSCIREQEEETLEAAIQALLSGKGVKAEVGTMINQGMTVREILEETIPGEMLDISGCSLTEILYFISNKNPVILLTGETTADLIVGYDNYNMIFYNLMDGTYYKMGRNDTAEYIEQMGSYLFTCR